jgi:hypothetical protein
MKREKGGNKILVIRGDIESKKSQVLSGIVE